MDIARLQLVVDGQQGMAETARVGRSLESLGNKAGKIFSDLKNLLKNVITLLGIVGAAAVAAVTPMVKTWADYEQQMKNVQAVLRGTGREMAFLSSQARKLGADTVFSASEAAQGMQFLAQAGMSASQIGKAMPGVLNMAAAEMMDLATASDIASNVLSGFGLDASKMGRVANVLAEGSAIANTNIRELGEGLKVTAPVARSLGVSLEDTVAALGALSQAGIKGEFGGTTLKTMFAELEKLQTEGGKNADILERLGLKIDDVKIKTQGFDKVMEAFGKTSMTTGEAVQLFGTRGFVGMLALIDQQKVFERLQDGLAKAGDSAKEMADIKNDTLLGSWKELKSIIEETTLKLTGDSGFGAMLRSSIQDVIEWLKKLNKEWPQLEIRAIAFAWVVRDALIDIEYAFKASWRDIKDGFAQFIESLKLMVLPFVEFFKALVPENNYGAFGQDQAKAIRKSQEWYRNNPGQGDPELRDFYMNYNEERLKAMENAPTVGDRMQQAINKIGEAINKREAGTNTSFEEWDKAKADLAKEMEEAMQGVLQRALKGQADAKPLPDQDWAGDTKNGQITRTARDLQDFKWRELVGMRNEQKDYAQSDAVARGGPEAVERAYAQLQKYEEEMSRRLKTNAVEVADAWLFGFQRITEGFGTMSERMTEMGAGIAESLDNNITDNLTAMVMQTKTVGEAFRDMSLSIVQDLINIAIRQMIVRSILGAFGGMFGGGGLPAGSLGGDVSGSAFAGMSHAGGVAGSGRFPRYHNGGVVGDEMMTVQRRGEVTFTPDQMQALGKAMGGGDKRPVQITNVNVVDPALVDERIAANPNIVLNVLRKNSRQVKTMLK